MAKTILPFKQKEIYLGLAEISGLLRISENALEIEYKVKDTTLGFLDSSVKTCRIPLRIIDSVEVEEKWFSGKFEMTFHRIPDLDNPFKLEGNSLTLTVKKRDLDRAQTFRSKMLYEILDRELDTLDEKKTEAKEPFPKQKRNPQSSSRSQSDEKSGNGGLENMLREE